MAVIDRLRAVQIKANLIADRRLGLMEIDVDVHSGVAVLSGSVSTEEEKHAAEEIACSIEGILEVENQISVFPGSKDEILTQTINKTHLGYGPAEGDASDTAYGISEEPAPPGPGMAASEQFPGEYNDAEVEKDVGERLHSQHQVDVAGIAFKSVNQIVYLSGRIKSSEDLRKLQDIILNARGVLGVSSAVVIEQDDDGTAIS